VGEVKRNRGDIGKKQVEVEGESATGKGKQNVGKKRKKVTPRKTQSAWGQKEFTRKTVKKRTKNFEKRIK